jgi:deoxyadenosine/deoxycytidine kinase
MTVSESDKIIVSVEGNIGVGKSTFINILKTKWDYEGGCEVVPEPIDLWKNLVNTDGKNILKTFYEDIPRWAYSFQNVACITRMMKIEESIRNSSSKYIFLDRSLGTDKNVFEAMLHDQGQINELEHQMYNLWCDFYHQYVRSQSNQIYIYLKASPETCASRIKKRGRVEEESIGLDYLKGLNNYHDSWLLSEPNVMIIDCEEEFENDLDKHNWMINQIKSKLDLITSENKNKNKIEIETESVADNKTSLRKNIVLEDI